MTATPVIVRYRGLLLALIVLFAVLVLLAIPAALVLGRWALAAAFTVSLVASMLLYAIVKDYRP